MTGRHRAPVKHHHLTRRSIGTALVAASATGVLVTSDPPTRPIPAIVGERDPAVRLTHPLFSTSITIPASQYTVLAGDTLSGIAANEGESWRDLYADNTATVGPDPDHIFPGEVLTVPETVNPAPSLAPATGRHATTGQHAVDTARKYLGRPYVWGGAGPDAFDCSGLVKFVYGQLGVEEPHSSAAQSTIGALVGSLAEAQPGDLLFFFTPVRHVAIYVGNGQMIAAPDSGDVVKQQAVWATPTVIRRVL